VTVLLTVDPRTAQHRIDTRGYDHETLDYLAASSAAYRSLPEYDRFRVVDGNGTPDEVAAAVRAALPAIAPETPGRVKIRTTLLTGGPILAGAAALGHQLAEAF
jgi:dTMP kinase